MFNDYGGIISFPKNSGQATIRKICNLHIKSLPNMEITTLNRFGTDSPLAHQHQNHPHQNRHLNHLLHLCHQSCLPLVGILSARDETRQFHQGVHHVEMHVNHIDL